MTTVERPFVVVECEQRSDEWWQARIGRLTSSLADKVFKSCFDPVPLEGRAKGSPSIQTKKLALRLACEFLNGVSLEDDAAKRVAHVQRGRDKEEDARLAYEAFTGRFVNTVGFIAHPTLMIGASLDGYVGDFEGITEFKAPETHTHLDYLVDPYAPSDYLPQIRHQLLLSGAEWCDFASFDDRLRPKLQLVIRRVWRKDVDLEGHARIVGAFLGEVKRETERLIALEAAA